MPDSASSFTRRRMMARLVALRPLLIGTALLVLLGFAAWVVMFSSWLAAQHVTVVGETTVSAAAVEDAAGVSMGTPLVRLDLGAIQARVAALPAVQSVTVHRAWPHTVSISITERKPLAAIQRDGAWWVADADGVIYAKTGRRESGLPVIAVPVKAGPDAVREAASVISKLPSSVLSQTKRLTAQSMDSITLRLKDKRSVVWGSAAESDRKVEVLQALLMHTKAGQYDVSVPEQPTTSH